MNLLPKMDWPVLVLAILIAFVTPAVAQSKSLGLEFVEETQYRSIPLASNPFGAAELPSQIDLSSRMPLPGNQGNQNSCVGWAVAYALKSFQEQVEEQWPLNTNGGPNHNTVFSPSFIYNQINNGVDGGSLFVDAFNVLSSEGAAPLRDMPYSDYSAPIPESARQAARRYRIDTWRRVNVQDTRELKAQLNANYPVVIGAIVDDGFTRLGPGEIWSQTVGQRHGGHAMVVVGFDDSKGAFKVINSWGINWGSQGYGWISYDHFPRVVREAYVAKDASNRGAPPSVNPTPSEDRFTPPPPTGANATMTINNIAHNQMHPQFGLGMMIYGTVSIPSGSFGQAMVVITFTDNAGDPVGSMTPMYALPTGQAATGTPPLPLNGQAVSGITFNAFLPYCALNVPKGQMCLPFPQGPIMTSNLLGHPVLFINDFGVAQGQVFNFFVNL